jgi:uncharacterized surface protein with fasciclin (FAS1) repeats
MRSLLLVLACGLSVTAAAAGETHKVKSASLPGYSSIGQTFTRPVERGTVLAIAQTDPDLSTFVRLAKLAGLEAKLKSEGPFTIFAPTNRAFAGLPAGQLITLESADHKAELVKLIGYHVALGEMTTSDMSGRQSLETLEGAEMVVSATMNKIDIGGAHLVVADKFASNGVVHSIDTVLSVPAKPSFIAKRN